MRTIFDSHMQWDRKIVGCVILLFSDEFNILRKNIAKELATEQKAVRYGLLGAAYYYYYIYIIDGRPHCERGRNRNATRDHRPETRARPNTSCIIVICGARPPLY